MSTSAPGQLSGWMVSMVPLDQWNPQQYERFKEQRSQPFYDLIELIDPKPAMRVIDLGCGTGVLTHVLHHRLSAAETLGIDASNAMLQQARTLAGEGLHFAQQTIEAWHANHAYDLVFSNAALHWVADHRSLWSRLKSALCKEGQLAIQMPANHDHLSHSLAAEVAQTSPFRDALGGYVRANPVLPVEDYACCLEELGFREQHVRLQVYGHRLAHAGEVVEWVKGTLLTDYERRLPEELYHRFVECYRTKLLSSLGEHRPYFYTFKRILLWAKL